ncbi:MAG: UDP-N-acetylglucosamine 2-epimerase (non-hydrolyzing) [Saprospiraceae bacterium]
MHKVIAIVGARPQFIKHFALEKATKGRIHLETIHTGQHYDDNMSNIFFDQLGMNKPTFQLHLGGGNHGTQTGRMMEAIETIVLNVNPNCILVYGDTNSTLAGALVASKLHIPVAHVEAGLRSYNRNMPEEINRVLTDQLSDYLFVPSEQSIQNLQKEGIGGKVFTVGDIMKDVVLYCKQNSLVKIPDIRDYYYATIHRPYNTDDPDRLKEILNLFNGLKKKVIFAIHPRTRQAMTSIDLLEDRFENIIFIDPQSYFDNLGYIQYCDTLITDSGGMQKEAYWLEKRCITIRSETEWTETLLDGKNTLVFDELSVLPQQLESENHGIFDPILYGQGNAGEIIVDILVKNLKSK